MGIRLDWEVDSGPGSRSVGTEDPDRQRQHRVMRLRVLAIIVGIIFGLSVAVAVVVWRLNEANAYIESLLRDTVEAEFAALRLSDKTAFIGIQRSATDDWQTYQSQIFDAFQNGKLAGSITLTGTVRGVEIDGTRGRAIVEWIEGGIPYSQAWFYWRYEDGWRHVPPDTTFWGKSEALRGQNVTVLYQEVDAALAEVMGLRVEGWIASVCGPILQCGDLPHISLTITPDIYTEKGWGRATQAWTLTLDSPYITGARSDQPFSGATLETVANAVAERLVGAGLGSSDPFDRTTDAGYLIQATQTWLTGQFVGLDTGSTLIQSLADNAGRATLGTLLKALRPTSTLDVILVVLGQNDVRAVNLNWSDFFAKRIRLESDYASADNLPGMIALYADESRQNALDRLAIKAIPSAVTFSITQTSNAPDGAATISGTARSTYGATVQEQPVQFVWRNGTWLRSN